jgi:thioredoxin reductase (NADPH)
LLYDLIVVGKGPAGISAALYVRRAGFSVLVIGKEMGSLEKSEKIENYYGFPEGISGKELVQSGIAQAENLGVEVKTAEVLSVAKEKDFSVGTTGGALRERPSFLPRENPGRALNRSFEEFKGRGIVFAPYGDGFSTAKNAGRHRKRRLTPYPNFTSFWRFRRISLCSPTDRF